MELVHEFDFTAELAESVFVAEGRIHPGPVVEYRVYWVT